MSVVDVDEIQYALSCFYAMAAPVSTSMTMASILVVFVDPSDIHDNGRSEELENVQDSIIYATLFVIAATAMTFFIAYAYSMGYSAIVSKAMVANIVIVLFILCLQLQTRFFENIEVPMDMITLLITAWTFATIGGYSLMESEELPRGFTQVCMYETNSWHQLNMSRLIRYV